MMEEGAATEERRDLFVREVTAAMANGSENAYREFFEKYFDRLYRHMLVLTRGNEDLARDLAQQVLLRVARYIKPFGGEGQLWAWLKQLARSAHVDWLRRNGKRGTELPLELLEESLAVEPGMDEDEELFVALHRGLNELEPGERELIQAVYSDEMSQKKVAELWNITPKAVESRLGRIRQKLRATILQKLKDYALL